MFLEVKATRDFSELRGAFWRFVRDDFVQLIFVCFGALFLREQMELEV